ncbi:MAG: hypothetical protein LKE37_09310 [Atopobiaceae bacterium]|jgi:tetratricopeptide (TPR) repeat protein|nr:hypothetical protein [Atopobiaceae bacterium]
MEPTSLTDSLLTAEAMLASQDASGAAELLGRLAEDAEEYVDRNCHTTDEVQWFSFPTIFDRLAYRRVEHDPRELRDVGEPLDRLYADLAYAQVSLGEYEQAGEALKRAVRWNPMDCRYRLDLAEIFRTNGDDQEYLALTYTVFERASDVRHLVRAYLNFARFWQAAGMHEQTAAALRCALRLNSDDPQLAEMAEVAKGTPDDPESLTDSEAADILADVGLPDGANAEIAICLLMCATDAADAGDRGLATNLTMRARDLVGTNAAAALVQLIREGDEDLLSPDDDQDGGEGDA